MTNRRIRKDGYQWRSSATTSEHGQCVHEVPVGLCIGECIQCGSITLHGLTLEPGITRKPLSCAWERRQWWIVDWQSWQYSSLLHGPHCVTGTFTSLSYWHVRLPKLGQLKLGWYHLCLKQTPPWRGTQFRTSLASYASRLTIIAILGSQFR